MINTMLFCIEATIMLESVILSEIL